eukprot:jgi/Orpsp1_1/1191668/evm.model.d7180000087659.1
MNNQPACPPRLASYDMALDHKITNQYMNNVQKGNQSSIYTQNVPLPVKGRSSYSNVSQSSNNYYSSMNRQNNQAYPSRVQQRLNSNTGDLSMQPVNNGIPSLSNNPNLNMVNATQYSDFNNNFYQANQSEKLGFFDVVPNLQKIFKQNNISKWTFLFIILQVIVIVTLESLLFFNDKDFNGKFAEVNDYMHKNDYDSEIYKNYNQSYNQSKCIVVYQLIFIVSQIFVLAIYYDSFRISSSFQLITASIFNFIIAIYSVIQIFKTNELFKDISSKLQDIDLPEKLLISEDGDLKNLLTSDKYKQIYNLVITIAIVLSVFATVILILSLFLFKKFGWNIYRNVGADINKTIILKRRYKFGIVLKFKSFFIFGIIAQLYIINDAINGNYHDIFNKYINVDNEYLIYIILSSALILLLIINIICGYNSVRKQSTTLMAIHILIDFIFIIFSIYMIYIVIVKKYDTVRKSLTGF